MEDALLPYYKRGADPKACRIWYKLNEGTKIRVRTGAGLSDYSDVRAVVGQGTMGGTLISQGVLDEGISQEFAPGEEDELKYGDVPFASLIFQDDVIHGAGGLKEARMANLKIDRVVKGMNLRLNEDKTFCIVMGTRKQKQEVKLGLERQPLMCGGLEIQLKDKFKWLV